MGGRPRILMVGLSVFTAASLACALATTDSFLIAMRVLGAHHGVRRSAGSLIRPGNVRNARVA